MKIAPWLLNNSLRSCGLWLRPGFIRKCFVKKTRNGEVFGLDFLRVDSLLCGELFSLGAASFAKDSEGEEGRKVATVPS